MIENKKKINLLNNLISGIGIIVFGIFIIKLNINLYTTFVNLIVYIFIIFGLSNLITFLLKKKIDRNNQMLIAIIVNIIFGIILLCIPKLSLSIIPLVFALYLLINSAAKFVDYIILKKVNLRIRFKSIIFSIFFLLLSIIFMFYPIKRLDLFIIIIGFYCLLLGLNRLLEFFVDILSDKFKLKIKKKFRVSLPVIIEAFIPKRALKFINKYINSTILDEKRDKEEADLKIFIHLSKYGFNQLGHMDIMFDGVIYSYGNYDKSSQRLFNSLGDGVLFSLRDKNKYISFCMKNSKKTIVEYGIKLTNYQKEKINKTLNDLLADSYAWKPKSIINNKKNNEYSVRLFKATKTKFYKFKSGEYKTYFVLGINCSYFADRLLKNCVFEVLKLVGIISPGTYYEYLEENYRKKNSNVISKTIYSIEK